MNDIHNVRIVDYLTEMREDYIKANSDEERKEYDRLARLKIDKDAKPESKECLHGYWGKLRDNLLKNGLS